LYFYVVNMTALITENAAQKAQIAQLKFELQQLKRALFGRKSERFIPEDQNPEQLNLFTGQAADDKLPEQQAEAVTETITYERNKPVAKPHPGRAPIPEHFPIEEVIIEPTEDVEGLTKIGEERTEWVEYTPASLIKKVIIRPKYARPEAYGDTKILIGTLPSRPIEKSIASASLLAYIIIAKFVDHLPFYRQIQRFKRDYEWTIHKSTINSWFVACCTLFKPLYQELVKQTLKIDYLQADESKIKVLTTIAKDKNGDASNKDKDKNSKQRLGWMWVIHDPVKGLVVFNYEDSRSANAANELLGDFKEGYLQVDGYDSYAGIAARAGVRRIGCMAHVRRKFFDAKFNDPKRAAYAMDVFKAIYRHERQAKDLSPDERKAYRLEHTAPIYQRFKEWMDNEGLLVTPKSPIGKAFTYAQNQWTNLCNIFFDGRILIDNNLIENKIRPLALGRKNYLFAGSHQAAQRIAMMYSFIATCKAHDVNPYLWFKNTLAKLPDTKRSQLKTLLPGYIHAVVEVDV